jgi:hypothetical protein
MSLVGAEMSHDAAFDCRQAPTNQRHSEPTIWTAACDSLLTLGRSASERDERTDHADPRRGKLT